MKTYAYISLALLLVVLSCAKDYRHDLVGRWNAGKATLNNDILVTVRADGTITAQVTNAGMKPVNASYTIVGDRLTIVFPSYSLSYRIVSIDNASLVMKSRYGKITWKRL